MTDRDPTFETTHWSRIRRASVQNDRDALQHLCQRYWYPLYCYLRRSGHTADTAQDLVQGFFTELLQRQSLGKADPERGRFRNFLLTACRNHVANVHRADRAIRRGGEMKGHSLEIQQGEERFSAEPASVQTAERLFDRAWALEIIDAAFARVRQTYESKGRGERFDALSPLVTPTDAPPSHAQIADQLGCTPAAVKVAAFRLRQQFADAIREEIAATIDADEPRQQEAMIDEELSELMTALQVDT
ncbi:MAG: sigma-70 family RNA polymerase sigma factor [Planctomycetota bacterium]